MAVPDPIDDEEQQRQRWLASCAVLDTGAEAAFDDLTRLAAHCFDVPKAAVSLSAPGRQWYKSRHGITRESMPRAETLCDVAVRERRLVIVEDMSLDPAWASRPEVAAPGGLRFYAGAPLCPDEGPAIGTFCILDVRPRQLDAGQQALLQGLARQVLAQLALRRQNAALREAQARHQALVRHSLDGLLQVDARGLIVAANPAAAGLVGLPADALRGRPLQGLLADSADGSAGSAPGPLPTGRGERRLLHAQGHWLDIEYAASTYPLADGQPVTDLIVRDVSALRALANRLREGDALLRNLAAHVPGVLYQFQRWPDGRVSFPFASEAIREVFEVSPEEARADALAVFGRIHPDDLDAFRQGILRSLETLQDWSQEFRVCLPQAGEGWRHGRSRPERLPDGSTIWHGFITDVSSRKAAEALNHQLAHYDPLTGLPNRSLLQQRLGQALSAAQRSGQGGALLHVDLDHFKHINDARGHVVGDSLLVWLASSFSEALRSHDVLARGGGDEFLVLLADLGDTPEAVARRAARVAEKLRAVLDRPHEVLGTAYRLTACVGVSVFPQGSQTADDLMREADTAMYRAKAAGRNRTVFFEATMQQDVAHRLALTQDLQQAVRDATLQVYVQSQVNAAAEVTGGELLLRWHHPVRGFVSPVEFIPVAEDSGLIVPIGLWVLRTACEALVRLDAAGRRITLSVNVSPRQFDDDDFIALVSELLHETGARPDGLLLEITEGLLVDNEQARDRIASLRTLGIRCSIDDFGTGYSSFSYLKRLDLHELKIDRSFVESVPDDRGDAAIVKAILSVARHLNLQVVAEGVETLAQAQFLVAHGCDCLQGFYFSRPAPIETWIETLLVPPLLAPPVQA